MLLYVVLKTICSNGGKRTMKFKIVADSCCDFDENGKKLDNI